MTDPSAQLWSEIRDFLQDIVGGAPVHERSREHAKEFVAQLDASLSQQPASDALQRYGRHDDGCEEEMWPGKGPRRCSCGFLEALAMGERLSAQIQAENRCLRAERNRAQEACRQMGERLSAQQPTQDALEALHQELEPGGGGGSNVYDAGGGDSTIATIVYKPRSDK